MAQGPTRVEGPVSGAAVPLVLDAQPLALPKGEVLVCSEWYGRRVLPPDTRGMAETASHDATKPRRSKDLRGFASYRCDYATLSVTTS